MAQKLNAQTIPGLTEDEIIANFMQIENEDVQQIQKEVCDAINTVLSLHEIKVETHYALDSIPGTEGLFYSQIDTNPKYLNPENLKKVVKHIYDRTSSIRTEIADILKDALTKVPENKYTLLRLDNEEEISLAPNENDPPSKDVQLKDSLDGKIVLNLGDDEGKEILSPRITQKQEPRRSQGPQVQQPVAPPPSRTQTQVLPPLRSGDYRHEPLPDGRHGNDAHEQKKAKAGVKKHWKDWLITPFIWKPFRNTVSGTQANTASEESHTQHRQNERDPKGLMQTIYNHPLFKALSFGSDFIWFQGASMLKKDIFGGSNSGVHDNHAD